MVNVTPELAWMAGARGKDTQSLFRPFFSPRNGQYLTVYNIFYCNVLSGRDSCLVSRELECPVVVESRRTNFNLPGYTAVPGYPGSAVGIGSHR